MSLGIRGRLTALAVVSTLAVAALSATAWRSYQQTRVFSPAYDDQMDDLGLVADVLPPPGYVIEASLAAATYLDTSDEGRRQAAKAVEQLRTDFEKSWATWIPKAPDEVERAARTASRDQGRKTLDLVKAYIAQVDAKAPAAVLHDLGAGVQRAYQEQRAMIDGIVAASDKRIAARADQLHRADAQAVSAIGGSGLVAGLIVLVGCWLISRSITRPIGRTMQHICHGTDQVSSAASEVSAGSQVIAQGASEQAASLEETTASLQELSATCSQNANNARQVNALASEAAQSSETGENRARAAATEVAGQMRELAAAIEAIRVSTDKTTQVIESIDDIAFQINLLALNAAVEAARAGEAGLGFAVVADEVRNLAARSTEEAKNTAALIKESRANTERVSAVSKAVQEHLSRTLETDVVSNFQRLVGVVRKVSQLAAEVAAASDEQAKGVDQINAAVAQMDKVTQENAAGAEESAAASVEMQSQASDLLSAVGELRRVVDGGGASAPAAAPAAPARAPAQAPARRPSAALQVPRASSNGAYAARNGDGQRKPADVLPLTDAEAADHQGDFSRF